MPERVSIFISYRRDDDSIDPAMVICGALERRFGEDYVWMDIKNIQPGDDFDRIIDEKVRRCNVLIAVIGPRWAELLEQRLGHPADYVRREIGCALARDTRVIPVLVGGATVAALGALPEDLVALRTIDALTFPKLDRKLYINALVEAVQGRPFEEVAKALERSRRLARVVRLTGLAIGLVMFLAASVALLDRLYLPTLFASLTMWLGGLGAVTQPSGDVMTVTIDGETEKRIGREFDPTWRREHAQLVDRLSQAGARTIALDISLGKAMPEEDTRLADAFSRARLHKTAIVAAVYKKFEDGAPLSPEPLKEVLGRRVDRSEEHGWGIACGGKKFGFAYAMSLVVERDTEVPDHTILLPSLALAAFSGGGRVEVETEALEALEIRVRNMAPGDLPPRGRRASGNLDKVGFSMLQEVSQADLGSCPAISKNDRAGFQLLAPAPSGFWLQPSRRLAYEYVLGASAGELARVKGKIVLVGVTLPGLDQHLVTEGLRTTSRFGLELIADQLDAILRGEVIRPLDALAQLAVMLVLALGGAYAQWWGAPRPARVRCAALLGLAIAYLAAVIYLYRAYGLLLNPPYELGAFALAYWLMRWMQRREAP